jgi:hypothetical protein
MTQQAVGKMTGAAVVLAFLALACGKSDVPGREPGVIPSAYAPPAPMPTPSAVQVDQPTPAAPEPGVVGKVLDAVDPMTEVAQKVARDSVEQYELVKTGGDKMQICAHASMVVAAFVQAKDKENFAKWKAVERADCKKAGVPLQ